MKNTVSRRPSGIATEYHHPAGAASTVAGAGARTFVRSPASPIRAIPNSRSNQSRERLGARGALAPRPVAATTHWARPCTRPVGERSTNVQKLARLSAATRRHRMKAIAPALRACSNSMRSKVFRSTRQPRPWGLSMLGRRADCGCPHAAATPVEGADQSSSSPPSIPSCASSRPDRRRNGFADPEAGELARLDDRDAGTAAGQSNCAGAARRAAADDENVEVERRVAAHAMSSLGARWSSAKTTLPRGVRLRRDEAELGEIVHHPQMGGRAAVPGNRIGRRRDATHVVGPLRRPPVARAIQEIRLPGHRHQRRQVARAHLAVVQAEVEGHGIDASDPW